MTRDEWTAIAERCEQATGPDDHVVIAETTRAVKAGLGYKMSLGVFWSEDRGEWPSNVSRIMTSLDAITALIERELPSSSWRLHKVPTASPTRATAEILLHYERRFQGDAATPALALSAAFCRAMAAKETT